MICNVTAQPQVGTKSGKNQHYHQVGVHVCKNTVGFCSQEVACEYHQKEKADDASKQLGQGEKKRLFKHWLIDHFPGGDSQNPRHRICNLLLVLVRPQTK